MKLLASKFNEKKFFLRSQLYARAYVRIWTLRPCLATLITLQNCTKLLFYTPPGARYISIGLVDRNWIPFPGMGLTSWKYISQPLNVLFLAHFVPSLVTHARSFFAKAPWKGLTKEMALEITSVADE